MKNTTAKILAPAACLSFFLSAAAMLARLEPFYTGFYSFAWWSYILAAQAFLHLRKGRSLLFESPARFLLLLPLSTAVWLVFEALNFRLSNWHYINIPSDLAARWPGYPIAYSTVLPGIFTTMALLDFAGILRNHRIKPLGNPAGLYRPFIITGLLFLVLPLLWPNFFFPLIWGAFIFLLEPLNHRYGAPSLLRDWQNGSLRNFYLLMLSGALCGLLWEFWNYWAGAKWIYTVPYVGWLKIFEMPLLGFLGFPPFAVECFTMTSAFFLLISKIKAKYPPRAAAALFFAATLLAVISALFVFAGIDRFTIISYRDVTFFTFSPRP